MTEPTWSDETQKGYEAWERAHGNEPPPLSEILLKQIQLNESLLAKYIPPELKLPKKEVKMVTKLITKTGDAIPLTTEKPKRTRRPKGTAPGITVETYKEATVHVVIPSRPVGMKKVNIRLELDTKLNLLIEWPEGVTALDAITAFLIRPAK